MIEFCKTNQINIAILTETITKWNTINTEKINHKMKELDWNIEIIFADSKDYSYTKISSYQAGQWE